MTPRTPHTAPMSSRTPRSPRRSRLTLKAGLAVVAAGALTAVFLTVVSGQTDDVTISRDGFNLTCPARASEGSTYSCTLTNTTDAAAAWPVVSILHLSSDADRALVAGSPRDVQYGTLNPAVEVDTAAWWIGDILVAYSRFDWPGDAGAASESSDADSRSVPITIVDDADFEPAEKFYIALGSDASRGVGILYHGRQPIILRESDSRSIDAALSSIQIRTGISETTDIASPQASNPASVAYEVTEATITATTSDDRAQMVVEHTHRGAETMALDSGEESAAIGLAVGANTITIKVTAEDGATANTYAVVITRATGDGRDVKATAAGFDLTCPSSVSEGETLNCTLANTSSEPAPWPVVAIIHSRFDENPAIVAEDPEVPDTSPEFSKDVELSDTQTPAIDRERDRYNFGYGELFSGGSRERRVTYGYEKFDWSDTAKPTGETGAARTVSIKIVANDEGANLLELEETFYVALAPDGYSGLSDLTDNRAPVLIGADPEIVSLPTAPEVQVSAVTATNATVTVSTPEASGSTLYMRYRLAASGSSLPGTWSAVQSRTAAGTNVTFSLTGLAAGTHYEVQASLHATLPRAASTTARFATTLPATG